LKKEAFRAAQAADRSLGYWKKTGGNGEGKLGELVENPPKFKIPKMAIFEAGDIFFLTLVLDFQGVFYIEV